MVLPFKTEKVYKLENRYILSEQSLKGCNTKRLLLNINVPITPPPNIVLCIYEDKKYKKRYIQELIDSLQQVLDDED